MTGYPDSFVQKIEQTQQKLKILSHLLAQNLPQSVQLLETLEDLAISFEEVLALSLDLLSTQQSELMVSQRTLSAERQQYFELFNLAPDGYIVTNQRSVIEHINSTAATLLNRRQRLCIGRPIVVLVAPAERQRFYTLLNRL